MILTFLRTFTLQLAAAKKKCDPKVLEYVTDGGKTSESSLFPCMAPNGKGNYGESAESSAESFNNQYDEESFNNQYDEVRSLHPYGNQLLHPQSFPITTTAALHGLIITSS